MRASLAGRIVSTASIVAGLVFLCASLSASAGGYKLVAKVSEPFIVEGRLYPADVLSLRFVSPYNPTSSFHEVWIGDECLGVLLATRASESRGSRNMVLFQRDSEGHLVLVGYTLGEGGGAEFHRFARRSPAPRDLARLNAGREDVHPSSP